MATNTVCLCPDNFASLGHQCQDSAYRKENYFWKPAKWRKWEMKWQKLTVKPNILSLIWVKCIVYLHNNAYITIALIMLKMFTQNVSCENSCGLLCLCGFCLDLFHDFTFKISIVNILVANNFVFLKFCLKFLFPLWNIVWKIKMPSSENNKIIIVIKQNITEKWNPGYSSTIATSLIL